MGMMLTVLGGQLPPEQRAKVDEFRGRLHRVQQRTRDMISDLSPPGLYDLGLMPALQWLVVYLRGHDNLQIQLDGTVDEAAVPTELRVLVFRLVREMLRNVGQARQDRRGVREDQRRQEPAAGRGCGTRGAASPGIPTISPTRGAASACGASRPAWRKWADS